MGIKPEKAGLTPGKGTSDRIKNRVRGISRARGITRTKGFNYGPQYNNSENIVKNYILELRKTDKGICRSCGYRHDDCGFPNFTKPKR